MVFLMTCNNWLYINFAGPCLAHEIRYPGGDCSSDIWTEIYDDSIVGVKPASLPARM